MKTLTRRRSPRLLSDCSGAMTIEMSIFAVASFFMLPVLMDITSAISSSLTLSASLRAGTQIALVQPSNTSAISEAIAYAGGFSPEDVSVVTSSFCECSGITVTCHTSTCSGGTSPETFMILTASYDTPTYLEYPDPNPFAITRSTTIRVR